MKKTIYYFLSSVAAVTLMTFAGCSSTDNELPKIDGFNNSNEVASTNLKAHWTFDDTNNERLSSTAASNTYGTVGFETGRIGKALKLTKGALAYPNIAAINTADALANYTVSMWVKINNKKGTTSEGYTMLFGLFPDGLTANTTGDFMWGNLDMSVETSWFAPKTTPDTLVLKSRFIIKNADGSINGQDNRPDPRGNPPIGVFKQSGTWVHFVARWNATTHQFDLFGNGVSIGAYNDRGTTGALRMNVPCRAVFGNGATKEVGFANNPDQQTWSPMATASIDDVRVFNTVLTQAQITALYNLGVAGR
ncbi:MAG: hypothetical protein ACK5RG_16040 [Cyclobacteriaceae bacterium]|jgi:hypothetical protein|nr:LamG domain-containing protein [Flammeovirgaceae bacterium]